MQYPYLQGSDKIVMAFAPFKHGYRKCPIYIILYNNVEVSIANLDYSTADGYLYSNQ